MELSNILKYIGLLLTNSGLIATALTLLSLNYLIQAQIIPLALRQINISSSKIFKMVSSPKWFSNLSLFLNLHLAAWAIANHVCHQTNPTAPPASSLFWVRMAYVRRIAATPSSSLGSSAGVVPSIATLVTLKPHAASVPQGILCLTISAIHHAHRHTSMK
jgi:spore germination protein GerM